MPTALKPTSPFRPATALATALLLVAAAPALAVSYAEVKVSNLQFEVAPLDTESWSALVASGPSYTAHFLSLNGFSSELPAQTLMADGVLPGTLGTASASSGVSGGVLRSRADAGAGDVASATGETGVDLFAGFWAIPAQSRWRVSFVWTLSGGVTQDDPACGFGAGCETATADLLMSVNLGDINGLPTAPLSLTGEGGPASGQLGGNVVWSFDNLNEVAEDGFFSIQTSAYALGVVPAAPIPEPATAMLMLAGLAGCTLAARRRQRAAATAA